MSGMNGGAVDEEVFAARLMLGWVREPGSKALYELVRRFGPVEAWQRIASGRVESSLAQAAAARLRGMQPARVTAGLLRDAERLGVTILIPESPQWPSALDDLVRISVEGGDPIDRDTFPPHTLWVRGALPVEQLTQRCVAIVGARASSEYGRHMACELAYGLAQRGWIVVSGGAFGIDAAAHRGAMAADGQTISILASGVDRAYPVGNTAMFEHIVQNGLLVSEWPPGSEPHRVRFLIRNRVIAAISRGTIMVEAALRSGARQTLRRARQLGRVAMAVPGPATSETSQGCHEELRREGDDSVRLVSTTEHVLDEIGSIGQDLASVPRGPVRPLDLLSTLEKQIFDATPRVGGATPQQIAATVSLPVAYVLAALPALETRGYLKRAEDGTYRLTLKT